jgi:hypothetical protein
MFGKTEPTFRRPRLFQVLARFGGTTTVNFFRPLALRRFNTLRPPGVSIRVKNPCVLLRLILLG